MIDLPPALLVNPTADWRAAIRTTRNAVVAVAINSVCDGHRLGGTYRVFTQRPDRRGRAAFPDLTLAAPRRYATGAPVTGSARRTRLPQMESGPQFVATPVRRRDPDSPRWTRPGRPNDQAVATYRADRTRRFPREGWRIPGARMSVSTRGRATRSPESARETPPGQGASTRRHKSGYRRGLTQATAALNRRPGPARRPPEPPAISVSQLGGTAGDSRHSRGRQTGSSWPDPGRLLTRPEFFCFTCS